MTRRAIFWMLFLGAAGLAAVLPEFMEQPVEVVGPAAPRFAQAMAGEATANDGAATAPTAKVPAPNAPATGAAPAGRIDLPLEQLDQRRQAAPPKDVFQSKSWYVAPPPPKPVPPPPPPPPPPPSAPPLPFQFVGKLDDGGALKVFLQRGNRVVTVGVGDVIDNTYRVESITDTQMTLIYLPLDIRQVLSVGNKL